MSVSNARGSYVPEPSIWRALRRWLELQGPREFLPGKLSPAGPGRWEFATLPKSPAPFGPDHERLLAPKDPLTGALRWPANSLDRLLRNGLDHWVVFDDAKTASINHIDGVSLDYAHGIPGAATDDWEAMSRRLVDAYAVTLTTRLNTREAWEYFRPDLELVVEVAGLRMVNERRTRPDWVQVDLVRAGRRLGWVKSVGDSADLLERCLRSAGLEGATAEFTLREEGLVVTNSSIRLTDNWDDTLLRARDEKKLLVANITGGPPRDTKADGLVADLVLALHKAAQTAPRGFVGLKKFTEMLLPGSPRSERERLLQTAIEMGVVKVGEVPDGGSIAKTVSLDPSHPLAQQILDRAIGALPAPVSLAGPPLSSTVTAARAASAP